MAGIIGITSCSKDFTVAAPYKNTTVIYGLLDQGDSAHYIRIQKAFLDDTKSAITMAKIADSNYYPEQDLNVVVKAINKRTNTTVYTYPLHRVDLASEGLTKDTGTFFTSPNYAYKFTDKLDSQYRYRIVVTNTASGEVDSAETDIISEDKAAFFTNNFKYANSKLGFSDTTANAQYTLSGRAPNEAYYFEGLIRIHWVDSSGNVGKADSVDWNFASATSASTNNGSFNLTTNTMNLFYFLRSAMGLAPTSVSRYITGCDVFVYAATQDFYQYKQVTANQGLGITGQDIQPIYTNVKGKSVVGLFTSRAMTSVINVKFDATTISAFEHNSALYGVNIQGQR